MRGAVSPHHSLACEELSLESQETTHKSENVKIVALGDRPGRGSRRGGFLRFVFPRACSGPGKGTQGLKEAADSRAGCRHRPVLLRRESGVLHLGRVSKVPTASHKPPHPRQPQPCLLEKETDGTSLAVQWLRLLTANAEGMGSIPGWGAKTPQASWPKNRSNTVTSPIKNLITVHIKKKKKVLKNN